jgi:ethanolamine permease
MGIGMVALFSGKTNEIITMAVFGALSLYIISMVSMIQLRRNAPELIRPFKVPFYPAFPIIALIISILSFISMIIFNVTLAALFLFIMLCCFLIYKYFTGRKNKNSTTLV